jgi:predicted dehydrogenase
VNIGLIGCGGIGTLRATAVRNSTNLKLRAVSDVDVNRAEKVSAGAAVELDWKNLVARADLDAVIISTPPNLHAEMCIDALSAGKHVLCEKPLGRFPEECKEIVDAASKADRFLATGFNHRFYPAFEKARGWIAANRIGNLDHVRSYAGYSAAEHNHPWISDAAVTGGGALRDIGIHLIDLTRNFMKEVVDVKGFASNSVWKFNQCEDNGFLMMRSATGMSASLHASWTEWNGYRFSIELYGDRGCIRASCFPMFAELIQSAERGGATRRKADYFPYINVMEHVRSYRWVVVHSLRKELEAFVAAIEGRPSTIATGYDGLRAVEIAAAVSLE